MQRFAETHRKSARGQYSLGVVGSYDPRSRSEPCHAQQQKALALAVGNLIEGGSRKIEMISYAWSVSNIAEREAGYQHTMKQFSLSENIRIHRLKYKNIPDQMEKVVTEAVNKGAEALVFATNTLAIAGMKTLCKHNLRVPDDIAVVCFDSSEAFELYYTTVTYIKQPVEQFGQEALDLLVKAIGQKEQTKCSTITLNPELVTGNHLRGNSPQPIASRGVFYFYNRC